MVARKVIDPSEIFQTYWTLILRWEKAEGKGKTQEGYVTLT